eukprot:CAMPEP_0178987956 /NCGR_PEP_ID=MMETSP0795-20121207/3554_1 /TAXON_ID=88552 /ORGANISM="Amoebophrya sp., Strain Ameob2" /LENGTH=36 /DNA_ID= /DNA_START= /DNA_END= /DNA_ORIENTATION=
MSSAGFADAVFGRGGGGRPPRSRRGGIVVVPGVPAP